MSKPVSLADFGLSPEFGYLQHKDPSNSLPPGNESWDEMGKHLPKYLMASDFRARVERLPDFNLSKVNSDAELRRAMLVLSYIGMAYQWSSNDAAEVLPAKLAVPWFEIGKKLGRPPILSYASYAIDNWYRIDSSAPIELGNIALQQCFLAGQDEEWFILIHIDIEKKAGPALQAIELAQKAVSANDPLSLSAALSQLRNSISQMYQVLARMPERCDPYVYFHRVRPYIFGWKNNPALPNGVVYQGVSEYGNQGQSFRGETGAQSAIVPALDAALGIEHERDELREYLMEMRYYMPPEHVRFIEAVENGPSIRKYVEQNGDEVLLKLINESISLLADFRALHLQYAGEYIHAQAQKTPGNPSAVGTGGTPFMVYLRKHRDETRNQTI